MSVKVRFCVPRRGVGSSSEGQRPGNGRSDTALTDGPTAQPFASNDNVWPVGPKILVSSRYPRAAPFARETNGPSARHRPLGEATPLGLRLRGWRGRARLGVQYHQGDLAARRDPGVVGDVLGVGANLGGDADFGRVLVLRGLRGGARTQRVGGRRAREEITTRLEKGTSLISFLRSLNISDVPFSCSFSCLGMALRDWLAQVGG